MNNGIVAFVSTRVMTERVRIADVARLAAVWVGASALAVVASDAAIVAATLPVALAAAFFATGGRWALGRRAALVAALAAAALEPATVLPWIVAAACLSLYVFERGRGPVEQDLGELERYLERCRRRSEPATVLFLEARADATALRDLLGAARVTDSLVVKRQRAGRCEVFGLLEGSDVTREKVESRFAEILDGAAPAFGWASYPDDGPTLEVLFEHARERASAAPAHPQTAESPQPARYATAPASHPALARGFESSAEGVSS